MNRSEQINELATALAAAQLEMRAALKGNTNPHFKSRYAALPDVIEVAKVLNKHGLSYVQPTKAADDGAVIVETVLLHKSGQWLSGELLLRPQQNTPQGVGSALTYGRRYGLSSLVGIAADEDDDGNAASGKHQGNGAPAPTLSSEDLARIQAETYAELKKELEAAGSLAGLQEVAAKVAKAGAEKRLTEGQRLELSPVWAARQKALKAQVSQ